MPQTAGGIAYDHRKPTGRTLGKNDNDQLVFVHSGMADRTMWDRPWDQLSAEARLTRLDLRGFGDSATPPTGGDFRHTADLLEVLDRADVERAHLIASSFGAGVAVETALVAPERVASLLLCPPGGSLLHTATATLRAFFAAEKTALAADDLDAAVEANVQAWLVGSHRSITDLDPAVVEHVRRMQRRAFDAAAALGDTTEIELDPPALDRLGEVTVPTLQLVGGLDMDTVLDAADRIDAGLPDCTRVDWPDAAHLPSLEHPDRFVSLVRDWIGRVTTS